MARWIHTINITEKWKQARNEEITPQQLAIYIIEQLNTLPRDVETPILYLQYIVNDEEADFDDFDYAWNNVYDWADSHRVWIQT